MFVCIAIDKFNHVAEKLLTSLQETGSEACNRSKEKITRMNMTCVILHDMQFEKSIF